jgi:F-type H+-transporting ATPase subunit gamma
MRRPNQIQKDSDEIATVQDLTGVFESTASTQVAKVKSKAELAQEFFDLLWKRYSSIRMDPKQRIGNREPSEENDRKVFVIISAEAGLSGDIDQRLIETMLSNYDAKTTDIVVLGTHGAQQLRQKGIPYTHHFKVPETDQYIDVSPVINIIAAYGSISVYYEVYVSLGVQEIKVIDLASRIKDMGEDVDTDDIMTVADTIFEPSLDEIAEQMEQTMMTLALSQTILESTLAQAASRFNAMAGAKKRAEELLALLHLEFHHAKRSESDRRMREIMVSLKKKKQRARSRV